MVFRITGPFFLFGKFRSTIIFTVVLDLSTSN